MSETEKKPGFWDRLLGRGEEPRKPADPQDEAPAGTGRAPKNVGPDAAPPEMQAEWVESGHEDAPEREPHVPEEIGSPFDLPPGLAPEQETAPEALPKLSWLDRLGAGLRRSSDHLSASIGAVFTKRKLDEETLADLEDILVAADLGVETALSITERLRTDKFDKDITAADIREALAVEVARVLEPVARPLTVVPGAGPFVILMVGVNGSGKTTTIGKLTAKLKAEGRSVMLAAGDTFRAAAVEQLQVWGARNRVEVVTKPTGADAAGLAYDALALAREKGVDVLLIDTAGRLQNRAELMDELEKIVRVVKKLDAGAPHATLLTLDATTGQNALSQAEIFGQKAGVTGIVMTKLDGTARGGILVAIAKRFGLPVHYIGVGEGIEDLEPFDAQDFARAIAGPERQESTP